jgi:hypothetical protein
MWPLQWLCPVLSCTACTACTACKRPRHCLSRPLARSFLTHSLPGPPARRCRDRGQSSPTPGAWPFASWVPPGRSLLPALCVRSRPCPPGPRLAGAGADAVDVRAAASSGSASLVLLGGPATWNLPPRPSRTTRSRRTTSPPSDPSHACPRPVLGPHHRRQSASASLPYCTLHKGKASTTTPARTGHSMTVSSI